MANPALVEVYEDRIQRLEDGVTDCKVNLGVVKTQIADGVRMLSEKLDIVATLSERVGVLEEHRRLEDKLKEQEELVLAKKHERRARRFKYIASVGTGLAAVIGLLLKIVLGS